MAPSRKQKDARGANGKSSSQNSSRRADGSTEAARTPQPAGLPVELQQMILDVFRRAFPFDDYSAGLKTVVQEVKGHLFLRDFAAAFAKPEYLDAYALRWSASRALGYAEIFLHDDLRRVWLGDDPPLSNVNRPSASVLESSSLAEPPGASAGACTVVSIGGGGGAEVAACAAAARAHSNNFLVHAIDVADWSTCLAKLATALRTPPELSAYASERARAANQPFTDDSFEVRFSQHDVLAVTEAQLQNLLGGDVDLVTVMFTLNELFAASISRATAFLLALTDILRPGAWLLVVDSPGSYSEVKMGSGEDAKTRQYPIKWLLDHALLDVAGGGTGVRWKKHVSDDSRWFRLSPSLKYPIELESMRYQIHLYQRVRPEPVDSSSTR